MKKSFRTKKLTALFLCFALLFPLCSIGAFGLELPKPKERPVIPYALRDCEETETFVRRLPGEEKDLDTIVFLAEEGKRAMYLFSEPVKYVDENGETVDKDLTLVKTDGGYTAKANDIALLLPERLSDGVSLSYNGNGFALRPTEGGEESAAELTKENTVLYPDAFGAETALRYTPVFSGFKEDILLYRNVGKSSFSFTLISDTLVPFTDEAGALFFCDRESGEPLFRADDILCHDAKDYCFTGTLTAEPAGEENTFLLTVSVDPAILDDPELAYPVTVDPSIWLYANTSPKKILDATVSTDSGFSTGTSTTLFADSYPNSYDGKKYMLVSFPGLYSFHEFLKTTGYEVIIAKLIMICSSKGASCNGTTSYLYTGPIWSESSPPASTGHSSPSSYTAAPNVGSYSPFDIRTLFSSTSMNMRKGVFIAAYNSSATGYINYYSTESAQKPYLAFTYKINQADGIVSDHLYVMRNQCSGNFAYFPVAGSYLRQALPSTVKEGGKEFSKILFYISYDTSTGCYYLTPYNGGYCIMPSGDYVIENGSGGYIAGDEGAGWYIRKTNDGYFQFIPEEEVYNLRMLGMGDGGDGDCLEMEEYGANTTSSKWSLFLAVNAKNINQGVDGLCPAASVLQALYGAGVAGQVSGGTDSEKIATLYSSTGNYDGGVRNTLNSYLGTDTYRCIHESSFDDASDYGEEMYNSLLAGYAPIIHCVLPEYLPYYNYHISDGHYITITAINIADKYSLIVNDCTFLTAYQGVSFVSAYQALMSTQGVATTIYHTYSKSDAYPS